MKLFTTKSDVEKDILKIQNGKKPTLPKEEYIMKLKEALQGKNKSITPENALQKLFDSMKQCSNWIPALKFCYIIHRLMHILKARFC